MSVSESQAFDYAAAFDRNLGWITPEDQEILKRSKVAIAGLGGAGGAQIQALARLGVGKFKIADPDHFELTNFNRQIGATVETIGRSKTDVLRNMILGINPDAQIEILNDGIDEKNIGAFLDSVDLVLDGIDFFAPDAKAVLFGQCYERKIPALTSCPLGFGASLIVFTPEGMKYDRYFDLAHAKSPEEKLIAFAYGLSPDPLCVSYMHKSFFNLKARRTPSTAPGLMLVGSLTGTEAVKILCKKPGVLPCPHVFQIDMYLQKGSRKKYPSGLGTPWHRFRRFVMRKRVGL